jgi:MYXO-CTERM domain-containing protein
MTPAAIPKLFLSAGTKRRLWMLAALTLLCGAAMLPAMRTMADHGASLIAFESAGTVSRSQEILSEWGDAGRTAMWWQLGLDLPFLIGYGLFLAGACAAVARRAREAGKPRLEGAAVVLVWFGPLAAAGDFLQNVSLALVLEGHVTQPWTRIAALANPTTTSLTVSAGLFALGGALATRRRRSVAPAQESEVE